MRGGHQEVRCREIRIRQDWLSCKSVYCIIALKRIRKRSFAGDHDTLSMVIFGCIVLHQSSKRSLTIAAYQIMESLHGFSSAGTDSLALSGPMRLRVI